MRRPQVVLDTNVLVAGLRSRRGAAFKVPTLVGKGRFQTHLSVPLVLEYQDTLKRQPDDLMVSESAVEAVLDYHCAQGQRQEIFFLWRPFLKDPKDDLVLELAVKAQCDFIVTLKTRDFAGCEDFGLRAIVPREFLKHLGEAK